jgi:hypothetical protein
MSLFEQIISAIDNPNQQASSGELGDIVSTVQQLSNNYDTICLIDCRRLCSLCSATKARQRG